MKNSLIRLVVFTLFSMFATTVAYPQSIRAALIREWSNDSGGVLELKANANWVYTPKVGDPIKGTWTVSVFGEGKSRIVQIMISTTANGQNRTQPMSYGDNYLGQENSEFLLTVSSDIVPRAIYR